MGSFLNVVIARLPARESVVRPRSRCPRCRTPIKAAENVPVLSYLLLGGRCRYCRAPISLRYPMVELLTAALTIALVKVYGPSAPLIPALVLAWALIAGSFIDLDHRLLPNQITIPGLVAGLGFSFLPGGIDPLDALLGALLGGGILIGLIALYWVLRKVEGMGFGDVKLLAMIGAFLGMRGVVVTLLVGSLLAVVISMALMLAGRMKPEPPPAVSGADEEPAAPASWRYASMPFGPFLSLGAIAYLLFGMAILEWLGHLAVVEL